jgi:hypothetical protein
MITPGNPNAERLLRHLYQITMVEGKMIPENTLHGRTHYDSVQTKSQITKKHRAKNFMRRNKRKAATYGIGAAAAIATTVTGANLVAIPLFVAGYALTKGVTAAIRYRKYRFVKGLLAEASNQGKIDQLIDTILQHESPEKALSRLRHWFTHRHGNNVATFVDRIRMLCRHYDTFKRHFRLTLPHARQCDDVIATVQPMMCYYNMFCGIEEMLHVFTGCYLYVLNDFNIRQQEYSEKYRHTRAQLYRFVNDGSKHDNCSHCYYKGDGQGRGNYKGTSQWAINRLYHDASHSKQIFGSGGKNRLEWVKQAIGFGDAPELPPDSMGNSGGDVAKGLTKDTTTAVIFDPSSPHSSHVVQSILGNIGTNTLIGGKSVSEGLAFSGNGGGLGSGIQSGLFSLSGENAAQLGSNVFAFAGVLAGVLIETGNSILNKWRLTHGKSLEEVSIKTKKGRKRLDVLRANFKSGLLEDWVDTYLQFKESDQEYMRRSRMLIGNCDDAYHLARAMLKRQKDFTQFMGPMQYATEFYTGTCVKISRMTAKWLLMSAQFCDHMADSFFSTRHGDSDCDGTFCYYNTNVWGEVSWASNGIMITKDAFRMQWAQLEVFSGDSMRRIMKQIDAGEFDDVIE